jgi:membrane protein insertase Oxa1/YidC/SpoIIIJ
VFGVAVSFFVMVFVATALAAHLFFLKCKKKNKRAAANTHNKNPRQKSCLKLNNIMCVIVFFSLAHASML